MRRCVCLHMQTRQVRHCKFQHVLAHIHHSLAAALTLTPPFAGVRLALPGRARQVAAVGPLPVRAGGLLRDGQGWVDLHRMCWMCSVLLWGVMLLRALAFVSLAGPPPSASSPSAITWCLVVADSDFASGKLVFNQTVGLKENTEVKKVRGK